MSNQIVMATPVEQMSTDILACWHTLFPNSGDISEVEARALAVYGHLHDLNVFNKELYLLKKDGKSLGMMPGIRGLRKHARKQLAREGGRGATYSLDIYEEVGNREKDKLGAGPDDLAFVCHLRDSVTMKNYLSLRQMIFTSSDGTWKDILKMGKDEAALRDMVKSTAEELIGKPPIVTAVGIVRALEMIQDSSGKLKRPLMMKNYQNPFYMGALRAERRALYQRFDLESLGRGDDDRAAVIDAEAMSIEDESRA